MAIAYNYTGTTIYYIIFFSLSLIARRFVANFFFFKFAVYNAAAAAAAAYVLRALEPPTILPPYFFFSYAQVKNTSALNRYFDTYARRHRRECVVIVHRVPSVYVRNAVKLFFFFPRFHAIPYLFIFFF